MMIITLTLKVYSVIRCRFLNVHKDLVYVNITPFYRINFPRSKRVSYPVDPPVHVTSEVYVNTYKYFAAGTTIVLINNGEPVEVDTEDSSFQSASSELYIAQKFFPYEATKLPSYLLVSSNQDSQ